MIASLNIRQKEPRLFFHEWDLYAVSGKKPSQDIRKVLCDPWNHRVVFALCLRICTDRHL